METQLPVFVDDGLRNLEALAGQRRQRRDAIVSEPTACAFNPLHSPPIAVAAGPGAVGVVEPFGTVQRGGELEAMFGQKRQLVVGEVMQGGCQHEAQGASGALISLDDPPGDGLHLLKIEQGLTSLEFDRQFLARPFEQPFHRLFGVRTFHVERSGARLLPGHLAVIACVVAAQRHHEDVESGSTHQVGLSAANLTEQGRQAASVDPGDGQVPGFQICKEG